MCSGIPYNIIVIDVPQRFQAVAQASPLGAAVRLLPFNALLAVSSVLINIIADKSQILPIWLILVGSLIQLAGLIWFCTLPQDATIPSTEYACQVLTGVGIGCVMGILLQIPPRVVEKRDLGMSALSPMLLLLVHVLMTQNSYFERRSSAIPSIWGRSWLVNLYNCIQQLFDKPLIGRFQELAGIGHSSIGPGSP